MIREGPFVSFFFSLSALLLSHAHTDSFEVEVSGTKDPHGLRVDKFCLVWAPVK